MMHEFHPIPEIYKCVPIPFHKISLHCNHTFYRNERVFLHTTPWGTWKAISSEGGSINMQLEQKYYSFWEVFSKEVFSSATRIAF